MSGHSPVGDARGSCVFNGNQLASRLVSSCTHLVVKVGGVSVPCLIETGSMVSTITENCFWLKFEPWGQETGGTVYVPVFNVGTIDVVLYPTTVIGTLREVYLVNLLVGLTEVPPVHVQVISCSVSATLMSEQINSVELGTLPAEEQKQVRALLWEFQEVFSTHAGDLGCIKLLAHEIPLTDNIPVRQ